MSDFSLDQFGMLHWLALPQLILSLCIIWLDCPDRPTANNHHQQDSLMHFGPQQTQIQPMQTHANPSGRPAICLPKEMQLFPK